jgi:hypothetical protein
MDKIAELIRTVALLSRQEIDGWRSHGPIGDRIQRGFVTYNGERYAIIRDDDRTVLVFTPREWNAFTDGVDKGEFNREAGLTKETAE